VPDGPRRIVVGVDGSDAAGRALDWAASEAIRRGEPLHLVAAWTVPLSLGYSFASSGPRVRDAAREALEQAAAEVRRRAPDLTLTTEAVELSPGPALVAAAKGADLLVVGSRGLGGFQGLLLGSVSQYCARHAECSVVIVR
jgi:nucleotide-binding universal stress UspA family protein